MMPLARSLAHALASLVWRGYSRVTEDVRMEDVIVAEATTPRPQRQLEVGALWIVVFVVLLSLGSSFQFQSNNPLAAHARLAAALPDESKPVLNANRNS